MKLSVSDHGVSILLQALGKTKYRVYVQVILYNKYAAYRIDSSVHALTVVASFVYCW